MKPSCCWPILCCCIRCSILPFVVNPSLCSSFLVNWALICFLKVSGCWPLLLCYAFCGLFIYVAKHMPVPFFSSKLQPILHLKCPAADQFYPVILSCILILVVKPRSVLFGSSKLGLALLFTIVLLPAKSTLMYLLHFLFEE